METRSSDPADKLYHLARAWTALIVAAAALALLVVGVPLWVLAVLAAVVAGVLTHR